MLYLTFHVAIQDSTRWFRIFCFWVVYFQYLTLYHVLGISSKLLYLLCLFYTVSYAVSCLTASSRFTELLTKKKWLDRVKGRRLCPQSRVNHLIVCPPRYSCQRLLWHKQLLLLVGWTGFTSHSSVRDFKCMVLQ